MANRAGDIERLSTKEVAARMGVSPQAVNKAVRNERIRRNDDGSFSWPAVAEEWARNTHQTGGNKHVMPVAQARVRKHPLAKPPKTNDEDDDLLSDRRFVAPEYDYGDDDDVDEDGIESMNIEDTKLKKARRLKLEHELAVARKEYIPAKDVEREIFSAFRALRNVLLAIPSRTGDMVAAEARAGLVDLEHRVFAVIDAEIRSALSGFKVPILQQRGDEVQDADTSSKG